MFSYQEVSCLNELELLVYHYVLKHRQQVIYMTIRELAEEVGVSTTTILRFCKKMGYAGYSEFRVRYKLFLQQEQAAVPAFGISELIHYFRSIDNVEFDQQLNAAAAMIAENERIIFVGAGTSGTLGKYGARFFSNVGKFSTHIDDPYYPVNSDMYRKAVAIILSVSGETHEMLRIASQFRLHQCRIISITNGDSSSLAQLADMNIAYHMPSVLLPGHHNITTQIPVIYILETLGKKVAQVAPLS